MEYVSAQNMNMRPEPNVNNSPIRSIPANVRVPVLETKDYPSGDKWALVEYQGAGWVAVIHLGKVYGTLIQEPVTPPPSVPNFPQKFTLTDDAGNKAEYVFVRVL